MRIGINFPVLVSDFSLFWAIRLHSGWGKWRE